MSTILIVEDEESLAESLSFSLKKGGYEVDTVSDGAKALDFLQNSTPDLILLDVMLPEKDGLEVCREVQKLDSPIPIIMITARSSETDKVVGLELGADDYIVKPFSTRELEARIKAVLRRRKGDKSPLKHELEIDFDRRILKKKGQVIELSPKEWDLLTVLAKEDGRIISKEKLLELIWGADFVGDPKTIEIHVHWLRQKIEDDSSHPRHVVTVKRKGYRFEP